jgi:hypothetical protein
MTSRRPSRRASFPSCGQYHSSARILCPHTAERSRVRNSWSWSPGISGRDSVSGNGGISCVPGEPRLCSRPALRPRRNRRIWPWRCTGAAPAVSTTKAPALRTFEAQSHGFGTGCLRFAGRVAPTPRKTRFRLLARLSRTGLTTRRVPSKGFLMYPTSILLSQALRSARTPYIIITFYFFLGPGF